MSEIEIHISTSAEFEPSERLRAALDRVIASYDAGISATGDDDVQGFTSGRLQIGSLDATIRPGASAGWRDGCWGYGRDKDSGVVWCGWYLSSGMDEGCIWMSGKLP